MPITMRKTLLIMLMIVLPLSITQAQNFTGANLHSITHNGIERQYYLYLPESDVGKILIVLHPSGSNGRAMQFVTGLNDYAESEGFAVVYPDAADYYWDDGRVAIGLPPDEGEFDDVGFISTLADTLSEELAINRIYLAGIENGGGMAFRVACELPDNFEAIITVAAIMWEYHRDNCGEATTPFNLLMIMGADHPNFIPEGEDVEYLSTGDIFRWLSWQDTVNIWRERNNCPESDEQVIEQGLTVYSNCDNDTQVAFWSIPNAGYNWARMADNSINRFGVDVSEVISAYIKGDDWQSLTEPQQGTTILARSWIVYVPSTYDPTTPSPLVLNLHGRLSNAASQAYTSDFNRIAEREGIIVLYPNGIDTEWNYLRGIFDVNVDDHSDEAFIRSLINDLDHDLNIDRNRMYVTGLSNGGFMTQRLACTMQDEFTAFASVAATAPYAINQFCEDANPVPMMYIHGTADRIVRWEGNLVQDADGTSFYISYPMQESFNFWGIHNQCSAEVENETLPVVDEETRTEIITLTGCAENSATIIYVVHGGGHVWHGTHTVEYELLGENSQDFNSSEVIWHFFSQYNLGQRID